MNQNEPQKVNKSRLDTIFVLTLFVLFAASLLTVTVYFAKVYRDTGERITERFDGSTAMTVLTQKIRAYDCSGGIEIIPREQGNILRLNEEIDGEEYSTYIYCHDGSLRELFNSAQTEFDENSGMPIIQADSFDIKQEGGSYMMTLTTDGKTLTRCVAPRVAQIGGAEDE